jgi:aminoglycoside phosphotransferase (APT) family kinase protein
VAVPTPEEVMRSLERELGVVVHAIDRQIRWRPCWFVDAERDGEPLRIVVRGERIDTCIIQPLAKEVAFQQILRDHGIPVPGILGWLADLGAVALERVPGQDHFHGVPDETRDVVVDEYLKELVRLHALDIAPFVEAGLLRGKTPEDSGMAMYDELERTWRAKKRRPNPWLEFALGWLHRHPPQSRGREAPIVWDSGQFHHHDGHLVALMDLDCAHLGDPMADLAVWRMRGAHIPFGDFGELYARYEELSGQPVDLEAVKRQYFACAMANELMFGPGVLDPVPGMDLMNTMQWTGATNLYAIEALGETLGIELPGGSHSGRCATSPGRTRSATPSSKPTSTTSTRSWATARRRGGKVTRSSSASCSPTPQKGATTRSSSRSSTAAHCAATC